MKQTAVEWLSEKLNNKAELSEFEIEAFKEAKEMEKQQIIDAMDVCQRTDFYVKYEHSEQYYNEKFNK